MAILINWQADPRSEGRAAVLDLLGRWQAGALDRRRFLAALGAALGALAAMPRGPRAAPADAASPAAAHIWPTVGAVQEHLFPQAPDSPGAADINATAYLQGVLAEPLVHASEKAFIVSGAEWLIDFTQKFKHRPFGELGAPDRETVLRLMERTAAGQKWLGLVLYYILEALLVDPVYGGNPGAVGWRWLEHKPGFPRPTPAQRYFEFYDY